MPTRFSATCRPRWSTSRWRRKRNEPGFAGFQPWHNRVAVTVCLQAVVNFLDREPTWQQEDLSWALTRMLTALNDLENGKPVPWLSARKRPGRLANSGRGGAPSGPMRWRRGVSDEGRQEPGGCRGELTRSADFRPGVRDLAWRRAR